MNSAGNKRSKQIREFLKIKNSTDLLQLDDSATSPTASSVLGIRRPMSYWLRVEPLVSKFMTHDKLIPHSLEFWFRSCNPNSARNKRNFCKIVSHRSAHVKRPTQFPTFYLKSPPYAYPACLLLSRRHKIKTDRIIFTTFLLTCFQILARVTIWYYVHIREVFINFLVLLSHPEYFFSYFITLKIISIGDWNISPVDDF